MRRQAARERKRRMEGGTTPQASTIYLAAELEGAPDTCLAGSAALSRGEPVPTSLENAFATQLKLSSLNSGVR